jgi:hypothetical protein
MMESTNNQTTSQATPGASNAESQDVKIRPTNRAVLKTLKDLHIKKARADHHLSLLTSALTEGRNIGGLRRDVRPQLPEIPVDLAIEWEEAHIVFTDTLTKLLAKYWTQKKEVIETEIRTTTLKVSPGTTEQETSKIAALSTAAFESEVTKLLAPKPQRAPRTTWPKGKRRRVGDSSQGTNSGQ